MDAGRGFEDGVRDHPDGPQPRPDTFAMRKESRTCSMLYTFAVAEISATGFDSLIHPRDEQNPV
jgi:hypothetical protein